MSDLERLARAICVEDRIDPEGAVIVGMKTMRAWEARVPKVRAVLTALHEPSDAQWDGLARAIMMWLDMHPKTPRALFAHLRATGEPIPQWLCDEPEMKALDHVPSKGTRCVIIYRAMIDVVLSDAE